MKPLLLISIFAILSQLLSTPTIYAQRNNPVDPDQEEPTDQTNARAARNGFWEASFPTGEFLVALRNIRAIAKHEYIISNAGTRVVEVTIETGGDTTTRIYYVEPVGANASGTTQRAIQRGQELVDRSGNRTNQNLTSQVTKEYPVTTHAKTIEYRVSDEAALNRVYQDLKKAWSSGRGSRVTVN